MANKKVKEPHVPPFGTMTTKLLEEIYDRNIDRYKVLWEDFIAECNGDMDAENVIVFKDLETDVLYRVSWENDGWNTVSDADDRALTVEVVKEVPVVAYKGVEVIQQSSW